MSWRRSPLVSGCATVLAVAALLAGVAVWNRRAIRARLDPSYRDPTDLVAVERALRVRCGTSNLSVFWTTRTPPGTRVPLDSTRRRRVGVHIVDSPRFADPGAAEAEAARVAREVRDAAGPAARVEVVVMRRPADGQGWQRRSFWFEGEPP